MSVTLDTLDLTPPELEAGQEAVRRMAYFNWIDAGAPGGRELDFWLEAEQQWIEHCYVPGRPLDAARQQSAGQPEAANRGQTPQRAKPKTRSRHTRVKH